MRIPIEITRKGFPALWEKGGGRSNTGFAVVICGKRGERLKPVYIRRRGELSCREHALFIIREGEVVVRADHHRGDFHIDVMRIRTVNKAEGYAETEILASFREGEWEPELPLEFREAVEAAMRKATSYHCRFPVFFKED